MAAPKELTIQNLDGQFTLVGLTKPDSHTVQNFLRKAKSEDTECDERIQKKKKEKKEKWEAEMVNRNDKANCVRNQTIQQDYTLSDPPDAVLTLVRTCPYCLQFSKRCPSGSLINPPLLQTARNQLVRSQSNLYGDRHPRHL